MLCLTNLCSEIKHVYITSTIKTEGRGPLDSVNNHLFAFMNKLPFLTIVLSYLCGVSCKTRLGLERAVGWFSLTDLKFYCFGIGYFFKMCCRTNQSRIFFQSLQTQYFLHMHSAQFISFEIFPLETSLHFVCDFQIAIGII